MNQEYYVVPDPGFTARHHDFYLPTTSSVSEVCKSLGLSKTTADAFTQIRSALLSQAESRDAASVYTFELHPGSPPSAMQIVAGAGLGISYDPLELSGVPGKACLQLFTTEPVSKSVAINYAIAAYGVSALSDPDIPVITIHTGPIDLLAHRFRMRPAPGGVSAGHNNIGAGTAGCLCRGLSEPRNQRLMILSNNHVFANVNNATIGDAIVQPGILDGGNVATDQIGLLEDFAPIDFKAANYVDCATAWVNPSDVRPELVYMSNGIPTYFNLSPNHVNAQPGMTVGKCGRTTQLTVGRVVSVKNSLNVNMGNGKIAFFDDQIAIQGLRGDFSRQGDSGSLVWTWDNERSPVGLLFAGGNGTTFANPINNVLQALDIELVV